MTLIGLRATRGADEIKSDEKKLESDTKKEGREDAAMPEEPPVVTQHSAQIGEKIISYRATAGFIYLKDFSEGKAKSDEEADAKKDAAGKDEPKQKAKMFYIAYTRNGVDDLAQRPVTFVFNGGPGSASIWLHMGGLGPRRAALSPEGEATPPPYEMVDNESSWLDDSDLVFIDPISTGLSRTVAGEDPRQYYGTRADIAEVAEFIRLYVTKNERWTSPKFLAGESYGTTRAAGLSDYLQSAYGLYLNGIVLISSVLDFSNIEFSPGNDLPYANFLPSFAAAAWYHQKLSPGLQSRSVAEVAQLARDFAGGAYKAALARGDQLSGPEREQLAAQIAGFTGLSKEEVLQQNLRIPDDYFFFALLKKEGRLIGRYDARFTGLSYHPGRDEADWDPSDEAVNGPFTAVFNAYLHHDLKFETDAPYHTTSDAANQNWDFGKMDESDTAESLRLAMTRNPYLKVWVTCSYYDLATPFFNAENVVAHMGLDPSLRGNIRLTYYESGHMLYIHEPSRHKFKADFEAFLKDATGKTLLPSAAR